MQTWKTLKLEQTADHIMTLTMNRPQRRNAINQEMADELYACLQGLWGRKDLRVLVLTGEGSAFGSGADLKERKDFRPDQTQHHRESVLRCIDALERFPSPVVAMINGPAFAGGFEIALGCDIRVSSDKATYALTEVRNVGSFPGAGGPVRLPKLVGRGRANLIVLTAQTFSAQQAYEFGFVEVVVPYERLREETYALASRIAANSPTGVRAAKQVIRQSNDLDVASATDLSRALRNPLDGSKDYREGISAWLEQRSPAFTGE